MIKSVCCQINETYCRHGAPIQGCSLERDTGIVQASLAPFVSGIRAESKTRRVFTSTIPPLSCTKIAMYSWTHALHVGRDRLWKYFRTKPVSIKAVLHCGKASSAPKWNVKSDRHSPSLLPSFWSLHPCLRPTLYCRLDCGSG